MFNFNDYPKDAYFHDPVNKKVIGKMKDEVGRNIVNEFVKLKSKMYYLVMVDDKKIKKANGVKKSIVVSIKRE